MRVMIEWAGPRPHYRPVGVWVEDGATFVVAFTSPKDGHHARDVMVRMKQADLIPDDFLEFHEDGLPPQFGDRGPIYETERYKTVHDAASAIIEHIRQEWDNQGRRWESNITDILY